MARFAVLGATSWGITLAARLQANGHDVVLLVRDEPEATRLRRDRGLERLSELRLADDIEVVPAVSFARGVPCEGLVVAVPAQSFAATVAGVVRQFGEVPVISAAKGIELGSGRRMSQVLADLGWRRGEIAVLSGPNLAHEVARGQPAAAVVASSDTATAEAWQRALSGPSFRLYRAADVVGVELAGALKNVVAIAAGTCDGLGLGANAVAALMTRGLAEMTRLGVALGAEALTFQGLAGVGDLAATCFSPLSRNRQFGELLAAGLGTAEARARIGGVVEGAATAPVALATAREAGVDVPITAQVCALLAGETTAAEAAKALLGRALTAERALPA